MGDFFRLLVYQLGFGIFLMLICLVCWRIGMRKKNVLKKQIFFSVAAVFLALSCFEFISFFRSGEPRLKYSGTFAANPLVSGRRGALGYGPDPDSCFEVSATCKRKDSIIYDVIYGFCKGKRVTPEFDSSATRYACFMGCSYTFGDGLNDNQTLAYFFNQDNKGLFQVENDGFSGYGTHHVYTLSKMLPAVRQGKKPNYAFYLFIPSHVDRTAGISEWDFYGPHYDVENGQLIYKGNFDQEKVFRQNFITRRIRTIWHNAALYKSFFQPKADEGDVRVVSRLIEEMNKNFAEKNMKLVVLFHNMDRRSALQNELISDVKKAGVSTLFTEDLIPDLKKSPQKYVIPFDGHPNELFNQTLAKKLTEAVIDIENRR